jgi:hypothetical protein
MHGEGIILPARGRTFAAEAAPAEYYLKFWMQNSGNIFLWHIRAGVA